MARTSQLSRMISGLVGFAVRRAAVVRPRPDDRDRLDEPRRYGEAPELRVDVDRDLPDDRARLDPLPVRWLRLPVRWRVAPLDAGLVAGELLGARVAMMLTVTSGTRPAQAPRAPRVANTRALDAGSDRE